MLLISFTSVLNTFAGGFALVFACKHVGTVVLTEIPMCCCVARHLPGIIAYHRNTFKADDPALQVCVQVYYVKYRQGDRTQMQACYHVARTYAP